MPGCGAAHAAASGLAAGNGDVAAWGVYADVPAAWAGKRQFPASGWCDDPCAPKPDGAPCAEDAGGGAGRGKV